MGYHDDSGKGFWKVQEGIEAFAERTHDVVSSSIRINENEGASGDVYENKGGELVECTWMSGLRKPADNYHLQPVSCFISGITPEVIEKKG